jgi:transposase
MTPLEARLTKEVEALRLENEGLRQENARQAQENKILREKIDLLVRRVFGSSSEKVDAGQLLLALEGMEAKKPEAACAAADALAAEESAKRRAKPRKKKGGITEEMLASLPKQQVVLVPDEVQANPEAYRLVDQEITRQLDYQPPSYVCREIIRERYARIDQPHRPPVIAPLPTMLERSKAGPGLLASIATGKYCDHQPLYRQQQIAKWRHGIELSRQDMSRWMGLVAEWLRPIYQIILGGMWGDGYAQIDETVIKYLDPGSGRAQHGYFWAVKRPGGDAVFHWDISRAASVLQKIVPADFGGTIQSDNYTAYPSFAKRHGKPITLAGCWAHVRRQFFEASQTGERRADAALIIKLIANLYEIEARLRARRASAKLRAVTRQAESRPITERIGRILRHWKSKRRHLPSGVMSKAINYTLGAWEALSVFIEDGRIEIDNNPVENAIRPTAVGKKNWLFIGDAEAGERSAIVFTVIEACRRRGINPFDYLRDVFTRMPLMAAADYPSLTPDEWLKARQPAKPASKASTATDASNQQRRCA